MEASEPKIEPSPRERQSASLQTVEDSPRLRIVILKADLLYGELVRQQILRDWPNARVEVFRRGMDALESIQRQVPDLFITGARIEDMDGLEHLEPFVESSLPILILTSRPMPRFFINARQIRFDGVYDAIEEGLGNLVAALRRVLVHEPYISTTFQPHLQKPKRSITLDELTDMEQVVLSVIGDGSDDLTAGERLGMSPDTVESHRKRIMKKLSFHQKGEMMVYALREGYLVVTPEGVKRPGFQRKLLKLGHSGAREAGFIRARIARSK